MHISMLVSLSTGQSTVSPLITHSATWYHAHSLYVRGNWSHPSILWSAYPVQGHWKLERFPARTGREVGYKLDRLYHTFTHTGNLESLFHDAWMSLDCGMIPTWAQREQENVTQKRFQLASRFKPSCCEWNESLCHLSENGTFRCLADLMQFSGCGCYLMDMGCRLFHDMTRSTFSF